MSPILGIWASQNYPRVTTSFESIATVSVGSGGSSSITFDNIPNTFSHLQFRVMLANTNATLDDTRWRVNDDSTAGNYYQAHQLRGNGASATASGINPGTGYILPIPYNASSTRFAVGIIDILDYANANKYKTFRALSGADLNGSGDVFLRSGLWMSTSAITKIVISPNSDNFAQYSHFALYGIRSA